MQPSVEYNNYEVEVSVESLIERASIIWNPPGAVRAHPKQFISPEPWPLPRGRVRGLLFTGRFQGVPFTIHRKDSGDPDLCRCHLLVTVRPLDWRPKTEIIIFEGLENRIQHAVDAAHDCIDMYFDKE